MTPAVVAFIVAALALAASAALKAADNRRTRIRQPDTPGGLVSVYLDFNDWWIGYYRGPNHHYVCPIPTVVIRWNRANS